MPKVLEARNGTPASDLVNIAQIFQRSGTLSVSWKDTEHHVARRTSRARRSASGTSATSSRSPRPPRKAGLTAGTDYEKVIQPFDMTLLLSKQIDVAEAMIYNEYAQVLEATNPETGELYQPTDLNVINYNDEGTAMLQDALFAARVVAGRGRQRGHRDGVPQGLVPGLDLLPRQPGRLHPVHGRRRLDACRPATRPG